jgi:hypothetical protein
MAKPQSFKPGDPRINRDGRPPKEWTWAGLLKEKLEEANGDKRLYKELVAEALRDKALQGDVVAIKEFGNRIDGMPKQSHEHSGELKISPIMGGTANVSSD